MARRAGQAAVHGVTQLDTTEWLNNNFLYIQDFISNVANMEGGKNLNCFLLGKLKVKIMF